MTACLIFSASHSMTSGPMTFRPERFILMIWRECDQFARRQCGGVKAGRSKRESAEKTANIVGSLSGASRSGTTQEKSFAGSHRERTSKISSGRDKSLSREGKFKRFVNNWSTREQS